MRGLFRWFLADALVAGLFGAGAASVAQEKKPPRQDTFSCLELLAAFAPDATANDPSTARRGLARDMLRLAAHAEAFTRLDEGSKVGARGPRASDLAKAIEHLGDLAPLTETQKSLAQSLRALQELRDATANSAKLPEAAKVLGLLSDVEGALPAADARRLRIDLAVRYYLAGQTAAAKQILPDAATPEWAEQAARDVKKQAQAEAATAGGAGQGGDKSPPRQGGGAGSPELPQPEGPPGSSRPSPRESALADMPPLGASASAALASRARTESVAQREQFRHRARDSWERANTAYRTNPVRPPDRSDPGGTANPGDDSEEEYLSQVESYLGRKLDSIERALALDLRRAGLRPAAAARVIRMAASARPKDQRPTNPAAPKR
jgi:hypothetical protein